MKFDKLVESILKESGNYPATFEDRLKEIQGLSKNPQAQINYLVTDLRYAEGQRKQEIMDFLQKTHNLSPEEIQQKLAAQRGSGGDVPPVGILKLTQQQKDYRLRNR